jgi:hypothetical protein
MLACIADRRPAAWPRQFRRNTDIAKVPNAGSERSLLLGGDLEDAAEEPFNVLVSEFRFRA